MKNDQIVRSVVAVAVVGAYAVYVGLNGSGPVDVPTLGVINPFVITLGVLLGLAFPEVVHAFPLGPTRKK